MTKRQQLLLFVIGLILPLVIFGLNALAGFEGSVAFDSHGYNALARNIVDHQINGLICKVKSPEDLAKKMIEMIKLPEQLRIKFAKNGRNKVENYFDEKIVISTYLESINDILSYEKNF